MAASESSGIWEGTLQPSLLCTWDACFTLVPEWLNPKPQVVIEL